MADIYKTVHHPESGEVYAVRVDGETGQVVWVHGPLSPAERGLDAAGLEDLMHHQLLAAKMADDAERLRGELSQRDEIEPTQEVTVHLTLRLTPAMAGLLQEAVGRAADMEFDGSRAEEVLVVLLGQDERELREEARTRQEERRLHPE